MGKNIFIVSGEASGDMHGAELIKSIKRLDPGISVCGMGGEKMRRAGLEGLDSKQVSVVGITEVIGKSPHILKAFAGLRRLLASRKFDAAVLIDFPDFNLRFAKSLKKAGVPIIYYISPQVWAWRKGRIKTIASLVKKMLVVFPFEEGIYKKAGVDARYVGHPLSDIARCELTRDEARRKVRAGGAKTVIALLPGSRTTEIKKTLGAMLGAARLINKNLAKGAVFLIPAADGVDGALFDGIIKGSGIDVRLVRGETYAALRAADAAIVTSGTATLETALIGTPMVIVYKLSGLTYLIGRLLVKVKHIGLPNIVAGRPVVKELIQNEASAENMAAEILNILNDSAKKDAIINGYDYVKRTLAPGGKRAADAAAEEILKTIG